MSVLVYARAGRGKWATLLMGAAIAVLASSVAPAFAHTGEGVAGGFMSGFAHPIFGWDHVVAMVAVGLWGAFLGAPAIYLLPIVFPLVMAFGAVLGVIGVPIPFVEVGIATSAVVLGALVLFAVTLPIWAAALIVGAFAIFHGYAHGVELPSAANPFAYGVGFVLATGCLHLVGIAFGLLLRWPVGATLVRIGGAVISAVGLAYLSGVA